MNGPLSLLDDGMPVQGASGIDADCQAQLCPDSMSGARWMELVALGERKKVSPNFDAILADVMAGKYSSVKQFAASLGKSAGWATQFRRIAINQGLVTGAEWTAYFRKGEGAHHG